MGHSMGGGGTLEAAKRPPDAQGGDPADAVERGQEPGRRSRAPTLVIGAENDSIAPVASHAAAVLQQTLPATPRTYLELRGASHFAPNSANTAIASSSISWLKRFVDSDTRYTQFLCPGPSGSAYSAVSTSCPF